MIAVPRLSVGLPVYNGERYLAESLNALLSQSYSDFEILISDNASTDTTEDICRRYAAEDPRIRYFRQSCNIGAAANHDYVRHAARGELFKWAAHDDLYGRDLLTRCVESLSEHPDAVLAHADMAYIDQNGDLLRRCEYTLNTNSPKAHDRFRSLLFTNGGDDQYGVIRTSVLRRVSPTASYHHAGRTLVAEIAFHGRFEHVPELLYLRRDHPARGDRLPTIQAVCANMEPRRGRHSTPRLLAEYVLGYARAIERAPVTSAERSLCYGHLMHWFAIRAGRGAINRILPPTSRTGPSAPALDGWRSAP